MFWCKHLNGVCFQVDQKQTDDKMQHFEKQWCNSENLKMRLFTLQFKDFSKDLDAMTYFKAIFQRILLLLHRFCIICYFIDSLHDYTMQKRLDIQFVIDNFWLIPCF